MSIASVFGNNRTQAVRLPADSCFPDTAKKSPCAEWGTIAYSPLLNMPGIVFFWRQNLSATIF